MLAVIGQDWVGKRPDGGRRIDDPNDWVAKEIECALDRSIPVIPVLIWPARLPDLDDIPLRIRELALRQAHGFYTDRAFDLSCLGLIEEIELKLYPRYIDRLQYRIRISVIKAHVTWVFIIVAALAILAAVWQISTYDQDNTMGATATWDKVDRAKLAKEIDALRLRTGDPVRERQIGFEEHASLGTPDYAGFDILTDERTWDLRGWQDLSVQAGLKMTSYVIMTRTCRVLKASEAHEIRFEGRTDGEELFLRSPSHLASSRELVQTQPSFVGARRTKVRQLAIDVSDVPVGTEFTVRIEATYWDSLQDPKDRWIGAVGYPRSDRIRMIVLLPENMPLKRYKLQQAPSNREPPAAFDGPIRVIQSEDGLSHMWDIPNPSGGFVYSMILDW